ncbi:hypothetical protein LCGC14_1874750 [marine sediment metagenome]|uniref:Uncharacterized protein n=1 Tax=marine sediment metagenome TaxID=412755 RepID=A0A0F9J2Q1_9ZZZZ
MIYEHVPDWFTLSCWVVGLILMVLVVIATRIKVR